MGVVEETLFENFRKALAAGNVDQAKKAVDLVKELKQRIERDGFIDYNNKTGQSFPIMGSFFDCSPYRYYPNKGIIVIDNFAVNLTFSENKLFYLFSQNESNGGNINIITTQQVKNYMWEQASVTNNAVRIAISRLREKIEPQSPTPQIIINVYSKGYVFLGRRIE